MNNHYETGNYFKKNKKLKPNNKHPWKWKRSALTESLPDKHKMVWRLSINKCLHEHESMHISSLLPFWNTARILKEMRHLPFVLPPRRSRHQIYQWWGNEARNIQKWRETVRTCSLKNIMQLDQNAKGLKWNLLELCLFIPVIAVGLQKRRYKTCKSAACSLDFVRSTACVQSHHCYHSCQVTDFI